jgi:hypothetical protein
MVNPSTITPASITSSLDLSSSPTSVTRAANAMGSRMDVTSAPSFWLMPPKRSWMR